MSKIESYVFEKDKIVIGGTLESLVYAYSQQLPVIYAVKKIPFQFDEVKHKNLKYFGLDPDVKHRKSEIWARTNFFLGLAGLLPMSDNVSSIRIKNSQLSVITKRYRNIKFNFNKLVVFDDEEIYGLPSIKKEIREKNRVFDWINVRSGCSHNLLRLQSDEQFVNEVIFYPTDRSNNRSLKDLVAISYLSDKQLHDFEYSDTMAKFKVTDMMKKAGIKGARNGRDVNNPEKYKYYAVKIEPAERVVENNVKKYYQSDERFIFIDETLEGLLGNVEKPKGYLLKISEAF